MAVSSNKPLPVASSAAGAAPWNHPFILLLLLLVFCQWAFITFLMMDREEHAWSHSMDCSRPVVHSTTQSQQYINEMDTTNEFSSKGDDANREDCISNNKRHNIEGVVATVIFKAPKWFHLRYTLMLQNAIANMPNDWHLQIFVNMPWADDNLWSWHPGLQRLIQENPKRMTLIPLPSRLIVRDVKPKTVIFDEWFWRSMLADNVLLVSGNGAFCANHVFYENNSTTPDNIWNHLSDFDYMGAPSLNHYGEGGDASVLSFRNRQAMLKVLRHANDTNVDMSKQSPDFFLDQMLHMNSKGLADFRIASRQQTELFAGPHNLANETGVVHVPLVVAGTQEKLSWDERESLLKHCPELKMIFPSMHEPACFGAHPKPDICKATICALREPLPGSGC